MVSAEVNRISHTRSEHPVLGAGFVDLSLVNSSATRTLLVTMFMNGYGVNSSTDQRLRLSESKGSVSNKEEFSESKNVFPSSTSFDEVER
jgi:hypothetical protein